MTQSPRTVPQWVRTCMCLSAAVSAIALVFASILGVQVPTLIGLSTSGHVLVALRLAFTREGKVQVATSYNSNMAHRDANLLATRPRAKKPRRSR